MNHSCAVFLVGLAFSQGVPSISFADDFAGQAVSVSGKVLLRSEKTQNQMNFLKAGDKINSGAVINTGTNGSVKLLMTDKTIIDLGPSSLFKINEYQLKQGGDRKVDVGLDYGQIRASVNQPVGDKGKFTIRTKAATMGVRGTEFVVASSQPKAGEPASAQQTQITVMKGRVDVSDLKSPNLAPVQVTSGMQLAKAADAPAKLTQLDVKQVQAVKAEAFQKDMTFMQTVAIEADSGESSNERSPSSSGDNKKDAPKDGAAPAEGASNRGSKQTLQNIAATVEAQAKAAPINMQMADLKLPGTFGPVGTQSQPVSILQGQPVNVRVLFTP